MSDQFKTVFEMKDVIERCFKECKEAGFIAEKPASPANYDVIINTDAIADHIAKTLIGELMEFEVLRKLAPMFRQFRSIENDMRYLDEKEAIASGFAALRIGNK